MTTSPSAGPDRRSGSALLIALSLAGYAILGAAPRASAAGPSGAREAPVVAQPAAAPADVPFEITPAMRAAGVTEADLVPGEPPVDVFNPDGKTPVEPALGGRVVVHLASEPPSLNFQVDNSASIRWIYYDVHAGLLQFDPATWEYEPDLATDYTVEDQLFLTDGDPATRSNIVFGKVDDEGDSYVVTSGSKHNPIERTVVPKSRVERLERATVWTFDLRDAVWHDGHPFTADDVVFSMENYKNPNVDCDEHRFNYDVFTSEKIDEHTVRFFRKEQFFGTKSNFGLEFTILPRHLYDLHDPENPDYDAGADAVKQGSYVNDNPHNIAWVGLGPYKVKEWIQGQTIKTEKFDGYWKKDPAEAGWFDEIWWRTITDDNAAFQALINDELDVFYRVKSEDFFGELTQQENFTSRCYKAFTYVGNLGYTSWNGYRKQFADVRVRRALAQAFDVPNWIATNYRGYALWSLCSTNFFGPAYNHEIVPLAYDPDAAMDALTDAGWYDRDGDGIVDKDGQDLVIEILMPSGNKASEKFLQALQTSYAEIGVKVEIQAIEWATLLERLLARDFDAVNMAWTLPDPESDPFQIWHGSEGAFEKRSSNHYGLQDAICDDLIERGRREMDDAKRAEIWHQLYARIYDLQPYLFGWTVPRKLAFSKKLRGVKLYKYEPGFRVRDMYYAAGTPGTRPAPTR
ncbi:MAG: hypothetical protein H6825_04360 [Planctomycetes bacterium]|nr:hypothetical protein [Planctomycetota bacterium]